MSFIFKKHKKPDLPKIWVMDPELYPQVLLNFRSIKNTINRYNEEKKLVFLFTGTERKAGVSSVAFNLALIYSLDIPEYRILLIDTNASNPILHKIFSINNEPGITDFLHGDVNYREIIYNSKIDNLKLIPFGGICEQIPSPFARKKFSDFIEYAKKEYDLIFIDSEPSITSGHTQSILCKIDGVVIVAESGKSPINIVNEIDIQMRNIGINLIIFILNRQKKIIPNFILKHI